MTVAFVHGPDDLRLDEVALPAPGPDDALIGVRRAGICGSDLGYVAAGGVSGPATRPIPLGHELSGVVLATGAAVTTVAAGDRVVVNPLVNMIGNGGPEGGFASHLLVRDVATRPGSLRRIPDALSFEAAALAEPLAVAAHAVDRLGAHPASMVAVFGAGPIGLLAIAALRHRGTKNIVALDPSPLRRDLALRLGARAALDPRSHPPGEALRSLHGTATVFGAALPATTHYLEASGALVLTDIVANARDRARICLVTAPRAAQPIAWGIVMAREIEIVGALGYPDGLDEAIGMLAGGAIDVEAMVSHRFDSADLLSAFATARRPDHAAKVLVRYGE